MVAADHSNIPLVGEAADTEGAHGRACFDFEEVEVH